MSENENRQGKSAPFSEGKGAGLALRTPAADDGLGTRKGAAGALHRPAARI
jgi:hypothetical protein